MFVINGCKSFNIDDIVVAQYLQIDLPNFNLGAFVVSHAVGLIDTLVMNYLSEI